MQPRHIALLPWREIDGRSVVMNPKRGEVHELDEVATFLWKQADGTRSVEDIAQTLAAEFEVDASVALSDAQEFFSSLEALGLIQCQS